MPTQMSSPVSLLTSGYSKSKMLSSILHPTNQKLTVLLFGLCGLLLAPANAQSDYLCPGDGCFGPKDPSAAYCDTCSAKPKCTDCNKRPCASDGKLCSECSRKRKMVESKCTKCSSAVREGVKVCSACKRREAPSTPKCTGCGGENAGRKGLCNTCDSPRPTTPKCTGCHRGAPTSGSTLCRDCSRKRTPTTTVVKCKQCKRVNVKTVGDLCATCTPRRGPVTPKCKCGRRVRNKGDRCAGCKCSACGGDLEEGDLHFCGGCKCITPKCYAQRQKNSYKCKKHTTTRVKPTPSNSSTRTPCPFRCNSVPCPHSINKRNTRQASNTRAAGYRVRRRNPRRRLNSTRRDSSILLRLTEEIEHASVRHQN